MSYCKMYSRCDPAGAIGAKLCDVVAIRVVVIVYVFVSYYTGGVYAE